MVAKLIKGKRITTVSDQQLTFAIFSRRPHFLLVACVAVMKQLFLPNFNLQIYNPNMRRKAQILPSCHETAYLEDTSSSKPFQYDSEKTSWTVKAD
jgi:hypothetical protein